MLATAPLPTVPDSSRSKPPAQQHQIDPSLHSVGERMNKAFVAYYQKRGIHLGQTNNWQRFFKDTDKDGSGRMTFQELDDAVRGRLNSGVSRYELRVFFQRVDADGSGQVTSKEFAQLMYRIEIAAWPDLLEGTLGRLVTTLNKHAERVHRSGGNWGKIFAELDSDGSGQLEFDEFRQCVRGYHPRLHIPAKEISDSELQGFWKLLDRDASMEVSVQEFMVFMRKHGSGHTMQKLTKYSKKQRGLEDRRPDPGPPPERSHEELRATSGCLERALQSYWAERGVHSNTHCGGGNWGRFFEEVDADSSGRLSFGEFTAALRGKLGKWTGSLSQDDVHALWAHMDPDGSGEVTAKELRVRLYRLELEAWPDAEEGVLRRTVAEMNAAAKRWHQAAGNWYKVFCIVDANGSGQAGFDEMRDMVRGTLPALQIPTSRISEQDLRALWKAMDSDMQGEVSVKEFMSFMRRYGSQHSMHRLTSYSVKMRGLGGGRDILAEIAEAPALSAEDLCGVARRVAQLLNAWLLKRGINTAASAAQGLGSTSPRLWALLFEFVDHERTGRLTYLQFEDTVLRVLRAEKTVSPNELKAFWRAVDTDHSGQVTDAEFGLEIYRMQLETWPKLDASTLKRLVTVINKSADKWHRCSGNWYKVFTAVDTAGSGEFDFDDMLRVMRCKFPGLSLTTKDMSDQEARGLWREIDGDRSGRVSTREFMAFMRHHGKEMCMHRLTTYSKGARGLLETKAELGPTPKRTAEQQLITTRLLDEALVAYWAKRSVHVNVRGNWPLFFKEINGSGSGRLTFWELESGIREMLGRRGGGGGGAGEGGLQSDGEEVVKGVTRDDLHALWATVDENGSGDVTAKEWHLGMYRVEVDSWPEADEVRIARVIEEINTAAEKFHQAGGNWYKVFRLMNSDNSGNMVFEEMKEIVYRPLPCLSISPKRVSEDDLRALWKALDADRSGSCTVNEFMIFMRRNGAKYSLHQSPRKVRPKFVGCRPRTEQATSAEEAVSSAGGLTEEQAALLGKTLEKQSTETFAKAYKSWGVPWTGMISEWDLLVVVRKLLGLSEEQLDDDRVFVVWRTLDQACAGHIPVGALLALGQGLKEVAAAGAVGGATAGGPAQPAAGAAAA